VKTELDIFEEYDDNNIDHIKNGPDYGNVNGKKYWNAPKYPPYEFKLFRYKYKFYNILNISK
jgi:hypothetical protein